MAVFDRGSKIPAVLFQPEPGAHSVRVIKADQAAAFLGPAHHTHAPVAKGPRPPAQVRLVASGPDFCDLEITCGCGEVTCFRAWTTAGAVAPAA